MSSVPLIELRDVRVDKIKKLREMGINPYPSKSFRTHYAESVKERYEDFEGRKVTVAGRLMSHRPHGKLTFMHIQDQTGQIQLVLEKNSLEPTNSSSGCLGYKDIKLLDIGDFVESTGIVIKTRRGEISIKSDSLKLLTKSLRALPEKWHGLKDRETILRQRYLYTVVEPAQKTQFEAFSRMLYAIRGFLQKKGFLEFHTPVIQPQYGGGTAKPFTTYVNALHSKMYLAISHELYLKRLIAAGFDKVFTIGRYFRNEGIDRNHHPEFSMLETMTAYENYEYNMDLIEDLFRYVAKEAFGKTVFCVQGNSVDLGKPWKRLPMAEAVLKITGLDFEKCISIEQANDHLNSIGVSESQPTIGKALATAFDEVVCEKLIEPTIVYGHPMDISPLAKATDTNPNYAERFEVIIGGMECSDNWSEQNDPQYLLDRLKSTQESIIGKGEEAPPIDYDFIEMLEHGMPPTTGIGPGLERMAMIFNEKDNIDDVLFFTMMKPSLSSANSVIFNLKESPSRRQHSIEDACMSIEEFCELIEENFITLETNEITIKPNLKIWHGSSEKGTCRASGYLEIEGVFRDTRLVLSGYTVKSEEALNPQIEAECFEDAIKNSVAVSIKARYPNCHINLESAIYIETV